MVSIPARPPVVASLPRAWLLTLLLAGSWAIAAPLTPDLAAQAYRTWVFAHHGFVVWDNAWYGGHHMPGYSMVFPPLASVLGLRLTGLLAATGSAFLFELTLRSLGVRRANLACLAFAVCCVGDLLVGRLTYALGVTVGMGAITALVRGHRRAAIGLAMACAATSPVAGIFLALACGVLVMADRRRGALGVGAAATLTVSAMAAGFPEGGSQPFGVVTMLELITLTVGAAMVVAPQRRSLRFGLLCYAVAAAACFVIASPMGGNVTRLGSGFLVPLLIAGGPRRGRIAAGLFAALLAGALCWQWNEALGEAHKGLDDPTASRAYYHVLVPQLRRDGAARGRVEVPLTRDHWETAFLARDVALARGWERQLDRRLNPLFYRRDADRRGLSRLAAGQRRPARRAARCADGSRRSAGGPPRRARAALPAPGLALAALAAVPRPITTLAGHRPGRPRAPGDDERPPDRAPPGSGHAARALESLLARRRRSGLRRRRARWLDARAGRVPGSHRALGAVLAARDARRREALLSVSARCRRSRLPNVMRAPARCRACALAPREGPLGVGRSLSRGRPACVERHMLRQGRRTPTRNCSRQRQARRRASLRRSCSAQESRAITIARGSSERAPGPRGTAAKDQ